MFYHCREIVPNHDFKTEVHTKLTFAYRYTAY